MSQSANGQAVYVRNCTKYYGKKLILNELSMNVNRGTIYGLLGASGCGKTTLLSCIVGIKTLNSGEIFVLGGKPGTEGSGVPGPRIGYMPQETALIPEFTVKDSVFYFGRIFDMPSSLIEERFQKLAKLLDLPPEDRYIKNCSGGQQRRVSFAVAMVHEPELLILDEPTVGMDSILRDSIWNYLVEVTEKNNAAVIITTHYIEEARQAHKIGLMRKGTLLAEESPGQLMDLFGTDTLEEVFLILSQRQNEGKLSDIELGVTVDDNRSVVNVVESSNSDISMVMSDMDHGSTDILTDKIVKKKSSVGGYSLNGRRFKALLYKNLIQFTRNLSGLTFTMLFPIVEVLAFLLAVGGDPKDLGLGIVNDEKMMGMCDNYNRTATARPYGYSFCDFDALSCRFIEDMEHPMINPLYYSDLDTAIEDVKHGRITGVIYFAENYTQSLQERYTEGISAEEGSLDNSNIKVWLDMSNRQTGATLKFKLLNIYIDFTKDLFKDCNYEPDLGGIPMRFNDPLYGNKDEVFTYFMIPGVLLTVMCFMGTTMTSTIIIQDRLDGVWNRSLVAGVSSLEIVLTHFITQLCLIAVQSIEVMILTFWIYKTEYFGSLVTIFIIILLQGLSGMSYGFYISVLSSSHSMSMIISTGSFFAMIMVSGMMWPIEGMPIFLQYMSNSLPFTIPIIGLRNVIVKGWSIINSQVISAVCIPLIWTFGFGIISLVLIRSKT